MASISSYIDFGAHSEALLQTLPTLHRRRSTENGIRRLGISPALLVQRDAWVEPDGLPCWNDALFNIHASEIRHEALNTAYIINSEKSMLPGLVITVGVSMLLSAQN